MHFADADLGKVAIDGERQGLGVKEIYPLIQECGLCLGFAIHSDQIGDGDAGIIKHVQQGCALKQGQQIGDKILVEA